MPYYYRSKFNNSYTNKSLSNPILGGAYKEIKSPEEKEKEKNTITVPTQKIERQNATVGNLTNKKISDEKLRRFINFTI